MTESAPPACPNPACRLAATRCIVPNSTVAGVIGPSLATAYALWYCPDCELGFVHPQPTATEISSLYRASYTYYQPIDDPESAREHVKRFVARWRHAHLVHGSGLSWAKTALARIVERSSGREASLTLGVPLVLPRTARLLDYGMGSGAWLLSMARRGYTQLSGYDLAPNETASRLAERAGLRIFIGDQARGIREQSFDLIRLEHVWEHVPDPVATLRTLRTLLVPGGWLVLTVPSLITWQPVDQLTVSPNLDHLQLPMHLFYHSLQSSRDFVSAAGLELVALRAVRPDRHISLAARRPTDASKAA